MPFGSHYSRASSTPEVGRCTSRFVAKQSYKYQIVLNRIVVLGASDGGLRLPSFDSHTTEDIGAPMVNSFKLSRIAGAPSTFEVPESILTDEMCQTHEVILRPGRKEVEDT